MCTLFVWQTAALRKPGSVPLSSPQAGLLLDTAALCSNDLLEPAGQVVAQAWHIEVGIDIRHNSFEACLILCSSFEPALVGRRPRQAQPGSKPPAWSHLTRNISNCISDCGSLLHRRRPSKLGVEGLGCIPVPRRLAPSTLLPLMSSPTLKGGAHATSTLFSG